MRRWLMGAGGLVVLGAAVIAMRTATFAPAAVADAADIKVAAAPAFDTAAAAQHLSAAVRFQTVSHQDPAENQLAEWDKLHSWLAATYPHAHAAMRRDTLGKALLYTWPGSRSSSWPIRTSCR